MEVYNLNKDKLAAKASVAYIICNFTVQGLNFLLMPFFTRMMGANDFGAFNVFLSWWTILNPICTLNVQVTMNRARYDFKNDFFKYCFSLISLSMIISFIVFFIIFLCFPLISNIIGLDKKYILFLFISIFLYSAINVFQMHQRIKYRYKLSVLITLLNSISVIILSLSLVFFLDDKLLARVIGYTLPTLLINTFIFLYYKNKSKGISLKYFKYALMICVPYIPQVFIENILLNSGKLFINTFYGTEQTAFFSVVMTCGSIISVLCVAINTGFMPWFSEKLIENKCDSINRVVKYIILILCYTLTGIMLVSPEILKYLFGDIYFTARYLMPLIISCSIIQFINNLYVNIEIFEKKTNKIIFILVCELLINVFLNLMLLPIFGIISEGFIMIISYLSLHVFHRLLCKKENLDNVFYSKIFYFCFIYLFITVAIIMLLYNYNIIRIIIIILYIVSFFIILFIYRKKIITILKKF